MNGNGSLLKKLTLQQAVLLTRRLCAVVVAILYIHTSIEAGVDTFRLLQNKVELATDFQVYDSKLVTQYAGATTIYQSPMLAALRYDTSPRATGTLFLEANSTHFTGCESIRESEIYQDAFQRAMFTSIRNSLAYNLTFLDAATTELVIPVVDCTFTSLTRGDVTSPRFFYLLRKRSNPNDVYIFAVTMSIQEYQVTKQKASGGTAVATLAFINDMRNTEVKHHFALAIGYPFKEPRFQVYTYSGLTADGYWELKSVPANPLTEVSKLVTTACPAGFYLSSPSEQSNIIYLIWQLYQEPTKVLSRWQWTGTTALRDTWAWVHFLHFYFAGTAIIGLLVLGVVMYYNVCSGKIWIGDAFVAISSPHWIRSALVIVSWLLEEYWPLMEFTLFSGNELAQSRSSFIYPSIVRADLMSLYITIASMLGEIFRERIDPALTVALFFLGFEARLDITELFPGMKQTLMDYADREFAMGIMPLDPSLTEITPMRVWNSKQLPRADVSIVLSALFPVFCTLVFIVVYVVARKAHRRMFPDLVAQQRSSLNSAKESDGMRSNLTQFEFATGVALRDRFGVVSDYENYVYIKGMKFASADGVYTSGFVIANGKFLIDIEDLKSILLIKVTRIRFKNIYIYEVDGNTVKRTARLLYPSTMSFRDTLQLNLKPPKAQHPFQRHELGDGLNIAQLRNHVIKLRKCVDPRTIDVSLRIWWWVLPTHYF